MEIRPTTPKKITKSLSAFMEAIGLSPSSAKFLSFKSMSSDYLAGHCLSNCEAHNKRTGDKIVYGWVIWEDPDLLYYSAEFHAVVEKESRLLDITPRKDREPQVLFAPDKNRTPARIDDRSWKSWQTCEFINGKIVQKPESVIFQAIIPNLINVE